MAKAQASGISLSHRDTSIAKGMLLRGDRQHDIAAYFGVNGGRIAEIAAGKNTYPNAKPTPEADLPPPGPYLSRYALQSVIDTLNEAIEALDLADAAEDIDDVKAALLLARDTIQEKIDGLQDAVPV
ncbi:MAG TPA: hypothetical protein VME45_00505 [Stellaceae bacterium]|nr:hypothetical protein [Stellaceae bacterium]